MIIKLRIQNLIDALESGEYNYCYGSLRTISETKTQHCSLGVAFQLLNKDWDGGSFRIHVCSAYGFSDTQYNDIAYLNDKYRSYDKVVEYLKRLI